jgi:hypothetical protein
MIQYKYMEEEDHFTQTLLSALIDALAAAAIAALSFSLFSYTHSPLSLSLSHFALK